MLFSCNKEIFNFCINNVVGKPVINKGLFYNFKFIKEDCSRGRKKFSSQNKCF